MLERTTAGKTIRILLLDSQVAVHSVVHVDKNTGIIVSVVLMLLAAVLTWCIVAHADVAATRFVKCNKCNHFFAVIPDSETKLNVKESGNDSRQQTERHPPPPPRKVCQLC